MSDEWMRIQKDLIRMGDGPNLTGRFDSAVCMSCQIPGRGAGPRKQGGRASKAGAGGGPSGVVFYLKLTMTQHYDTVNHLYYSKSRAGMLSYRALGQHCVQTQVA